MWHGRARNSRGNSPPTDRDFVTHFGAVREMRNLVPANRFREAMDVYRRMPELLKNHRHVLQMRVIACCNLEGQFDEALRAYRVAAPDDPGIDIFLTNYYALHRQFDNMLACVDRLDRAVGGDPLLDAYRALVHTQKGNLAAAKKCARTLLLRNPRRA